ncbi:MAG TPA: tetratricopeptide repeat protein [Gemmatales bacterium]|nr:tetratricopeptide repeat protein [Gemmatales bacterium]
MGRWSRLSWCVVLMPSLGCALPSMQQSAPSMPNKVGPEISSQPTVNSSAITKDPDLPPEKANQLCLATAEELEKNGHFEQACGQYELALQHDSRQPAVNKKLAACYAKAGLFDKSIAQYQKCIAASPKDADLINDLGYTYYEKEDFVTAEKHLRQSIALKPTLQRAHGNLGLALGRQCKWKESLEEFKKACSPGMAQANLAAMYLAAKQYDDARRSCNIALGLEPNLKTAKDLLAKLDEMPKNDAKTVQQAEARLLKESASKPEVVTARADLPADTKAASDAGDKLGANSIQLQKPVRANRQNESNEFRPVK